MSVLARPNHPLRLAAIFVAAAACSAIVAGAAVSLVYVIRDITAESSSVVDVPGPEGNVDAPEGLMIVVPVENARQFRDMTDFAPFVPKYVPSTTDPRPSFAVTQPDDAGRRVGRVSFSPKDGEDVDGITGPLIVLSEARGVPGEGVDGQLKRVDLPDVRAVAAAFACGDLVIDMRLYFGPDAAAGEDAVTPYMIDVGRQFLADVQEQCAD